MSNELLNKASAQALVFMQKEIWTHIIKNGFHVSVQTAGSNLPSKEVVGNWELEPALERMNSFLTELLLSQNQLLNAYSPIQKAESVDYALLYFCRFREALDEGGPLAQAVETAFNSFSVEDKRVSYTSPLNALIYTDEKYRTCLPIPFSSIYLPTEQVLVPTRVESNLLQFLALFGYLLSLNQFQAVAQTLGVGFGLIPYPEQIYLNPDSFFGDSKRPQFSAFVETYWQKTISLTHDCFSQIYTNKEGTSHNKETNWYNFMQVLKFLAGLTDVAKHTMFFSPVEAFKFTLTDSPDKIRKANLDRQVIRLFSTVNTLSDSSLNWGEKWLWYLGIKVTDEKDINAALFWLSQLTSEVCTAMSRMKANERETEVRKLLSRFKQTLDRYCVPLPVFVNGVRPILQRYV